MLQNSCAKNKGVNIKSGEAKKKKAREHYEKFLSFLKNADSSVPEVEAARKRRAGLKTQFLREIMALKIRG